MQSNQNYNGVQAQRIEQVCSHPEFRGGFFGSPIRRLAISALIGCTVGMFFHTVAMAEQPSEHLINSIILASICSVIWFFLLTLYSVAVKKDYCKLVHLDEMEVINHELKSRVECSKLADRKRKRLLKKIDDECAGKRMMTNNEFYQVLSKASSL
ncbi:MAG: hypothetical protein C9356_15170 [Oleiphilus sp.]|nr:MAG: hypothetical protein C9356_15170 [Oleiphilus sp.]